MTLVVSRLRTFAAGTLLILAALPLTAATSKRHIIGTLPNATIGGHVTNESGAYVKGADITNGTLRATTDDFGYYTMIIPAGRPTPLTVNHFAYKPQTRTITPTNGMTVDFVLSANPSIIVKTSAGATFDLDYDTSKFAYTIVFSGIIKDDNANLCKPDGSKVTPNKSEFSKIFGPGGSTTFPACCTLGPVTTVNAEFKSGEKTAVYFNDSCFGYEAEFLGRERSTGVFRYFAFKDIAEIDFP